jgi:pimeloyl-ACP methyl ester carboxylesterase
MLTPDIPDGDFAFLLAENLMLPMRYGAMLLIDHVMQDWRDVLSRIDVPTLVIGGEVSHVAPASQEWSASQIPGARLRVFGRAEGGAHFPFFEAPKEFAAVLTEFLAAAS